MECDESAPEDSLGSIVSEGRGEGGQRQPGYAARPGEPGSVGSLGERIFREWVVQGIYIFVCTGADGDQGGWLEAVELLQQRSGGGPGNVGIGELHGFEAALQGVYYPGADGLIHDDQDSGSGVSERRGVSGAFQVAGYFERLPNNFLPVILFRAPHGGLPDDPQQREYRHDFVSRTKVS